MKRILSRLAHALGIDVHRYAPKYDNSCVSLPAESVSPPRGNVLLAYILDPFLLKPGERVSTTHTHHAESVLITQVFRELGYAVDVIHFHNDEFVPKKDYVFFVSARIHLETIAKRLNKDCIKIAHLDTAHFLFNNAASYARALALQQRRGFTSTGISTRIFEDNLAIEHCNYAAVLGGAFCISTYTYSGKPIFRLPVPTNRTYPLDPDKDYHACRNRFIWSGSHGFVHKGLDLALEAFASTPNLHLNVLGRLDLEKDFVRFYHTELYETPNIHAVGWVDVAAQQFLDLANRCVGIVFPSCSESESCSVLTCMQAGLIPIVTYEAGIDVSDFGIMIKDSTVEAVREAIEELAALPASRLKEMSHKAWEYAHEYHSAEAYTRVYQAMITEILERRDDSSRGPNLDRGHQ